MSHTLYIFYKDERMALFKTNTTDLNEIYEYCSKQLIMDGFKKKMKIKNQIKFFKNFLEQIYKRKTNSYKIRHSDLLMFRDVAFALYKYNEYDINDIIILKNKN